jgi:hypothetical protein
MRSLQRQQRHTCDASCNDDLPDTLRRPGENGGLVCHGQHGVQGDKQ